MENRRSRLSELPEETLVSIFSLLDGESTLATSETCTFFARLANDHTVWHRVFYNEYKELLSHQQDSRPAFVAEYLLQKITTERVDSAQYFTRLLNLHLDKHRGAPWTHYYLAYIHLDGLGRPVNKLRAIDHFINGANMKDYRCHDELSLVLINMKYHLPDQFEEALSKLKATNMLERLISFLSYDAKSVLYAPELLAHYYYFGIGVKQDNAHAEALFLDSIRKGSTMNVQDYIDFKYETLGININRLPLPANSHTLLAGFLQELNILAEEINNRAVKATLYYHIAFQYGLLNNRKEKNKYLKLAISHNSVDAKIEYAEYNYSLHTTENNGRERAIAIMTELAGTGHKDATLKLFCWQNEDKCMDERLNSVKKLHSAAAGHLAHLAAWEFGEYPAKEILEHPYRVIWLQLAALDNHKYSLDKLQELEDENDPYIFCALGIIHTYGVSRASENLINQDKACNYFYKAQQLQPGIMEDYANIGLEEGLICDELAKFLKSQTIHLQPRLR